MRPQSELTPPRLREHSEEHQSTNVAYGQPHLRSGPAHTAFLGIPGQVRDAVDLESSI
jgi:hypothetical protein